MAFDPEKVERYEPNMGACDPSLRFVRAEDYDQLLELWLAARERE